MNLRQIEVFRAVMPLFQRTKGRLYPTEQAHVLFEEVEKVYKGVRIVQDVAQELAESRAGRLRIVTSPSLGLALVPKAIALFRRRREKVRISLEVLPQAELIESIVSHQADVGVSMFRVD